MRYGWEAKTVMDKNDNPTGFVSVGRDITDQKQLHGFLNKPYRVKDLAKNVRKVLDS